MQPIEISEIPKGIKQYTGKINSITFPRQGWTSDVAIIEVENGKYALKRTKEALYNQWLERETVVTRSINGLPVPAVEKFVADTVKNQSCLLLEFVEGDTLRQALGAETRQENREELLYNFGGILRKIHDTPCSDQLKQEKPWLETMLSDAAHNLANFGVDGDTALLADIQANRPAARPQTLIHGDFTLDNVLVDNGKVTAVIDWSGGAYGDPRYDLALAIRPKPEAFENKKDTEIFFEGYGGKFISQAEYNYFVSLYEFF